AVALKAPLQENTIVGDIIDDQDAGSRGCIAFDSTEFTIFAPQNGDAFGLGIFGGHRVILQTAVANLETADEMLISSVSVSSFIHASTRIVKHEPRPSSLVAVIPPPI